MRISARLAGEGTPLDRTASARSYAEEGFGRLLRHPHRRRASRRRHPAATPACPHRPLDFQTWPQRIDSRPGRAAAAGARPGRPGPARPGPRRRLPGARIVPALSWLLSLLALKLTRTRRVSHVDDLLLTDPAAALFAGLATLPKKSALTDYSYRTGHDHQRRFLAALDTKMIDTGLVTGQDAIFDLDFHAVMHWGHDPALEVRLVPTRSQRARSVLTFFAQDTGTHNLVYADADLTKSSRTGR